MPTLINLKNELKINSAALLACTTMQERLDLLTQRANLKDLIIEALEAQLSIEAKGA